MVTKPNELTFDKEIVAVVQGLQTHVATVVKTIPGHRILLIKMSPAEHLLAQQLTGTVLNFSSP